MQLQLDVRLCSDALFGASQGMAGAADVEAEMEPETGLPFLRGRTLKGLLVEACADLLHAATGSPALPRLEKAAAFLFGVPGSNLAAGASLRVGAARLPKALRSAVRDAVRGGSLLTREDVTEALTTLRRQTSLDDSGAPVEGSLRSARLVTGGLTLHATLRFDEPPSDDALALLAACTRAVQRGGTNRTRGMGRLDLVLREEDRDLTTEGGKHFASILRGEATSPLSPRGAAGESPVPKPPASPGGPVALRYRIVLEEPVLISSLEGDPNSAVGLDHIPGTTLRGAFVSRFLRGGRGLDLATDPQGRHFFFDGGIRFLNAYPVADDRRAIPTPRSWFHEKGHDTAVADFAIRPENERDDSVQWRRLSTPYSVLEGGSVQTASPDRSIALHIQRSRRHRITNERDDDRAVFRYDALAAGQTFEGALLCADTDAAIVARAWLEGQYSLGGTATAGYGACTITFLESTPLPDFDEWPEAGNADDALTLVLLAPLLLRDPETGMHTTSLHVLETALGGATGSKVEIDRAYTGEMLVGGFNRKWGLPLPQQRAFAPGSVFVLKTAPQTLKSLETSGLGERLAEGFGRVVVGRTTHDELSQDTLKHRPALAVAELTQDTGLEVARKILCSWMERSLERHVLSRALTLSKMKTAPSKSQLARLRQLFRSVLNQSLHNTQQRQEAQQRIDTFLKTLPQHARTQLERARLDDGTLLDWLRARAHAEGDLYSLVGLSNSQARLPAIGGQTAGVDEALAYRLHLRLAYATLALAAKQKLQVT